MTIKIPLDEVTTLEPGVAYSVDLTFGPDHIEGSVRLWQPTDQGEPLLVTEPTVADHVNLKTLPGG